MDAPDISVVVPVYSCSDCIAELIAQLKLALTNYKYEIILVDDCCPSNSTDQLSRLDNPDVVIIKNEFNMGQHKSIFKGLELIKGDLIVVMDCDLQDNPEHIPRMIQALPDHMDAVVCGREDRKDTNLKKLSSFLFYKTLSLLMDKKISGQVSNFGVYRRQLIDRITHKAPNKPFFPLEVISASTDIIALSLPHNQRYAGKSSYTVRKLIELSIYSAISFSTKPLLIIVMIGLFFSFMSFGASFVYLILAILGYFQVTGYASLIISIWFLSGLIIFSLGVVGLYIGEIFDNVRKLNR